MQNVIKLKHYKTTKIVNRAAHIGCMTNEEYIN